MAFTFTCCCILKNKKRSLNKKFWLVRISWNRGQRVFHLLPIRLNKNLYIVHAHQLLINSYNCKTSVVQRSSNFLWYLNLELPIPYSWYLGHISETPAANAIWLLNKRWDPLFFSSCYCSVIKHNLHHIMCLTLCLNCSRTFKTMIWLFQSTSQKCILILK